MVVFDCVVPAGTPADPRELGVLGELGDRHQRRGKAAHGVGVGLGLGEHKVLGDLQAADRQDLGRALPAGDGTLAHPLHRRQGPQLEGHDLKVHLSLRVHVAVVCPSFIFS